MQDKLVCPVIGTVGRGRWEVLPGELSDRAWVLIAAQSRFYSEQSERLYRPDDPSADPFTAERYRLMSSALNQALRGKSIDEVARWHGQQTTDLKCGDLRAFDYDCHTIVNFLHSALRS